MAGRDFLNNIKAPPNNIKCWLQTEIRSKWDYRHKKRGVYLHLKETLMFTEIQTTYNLSQRAWEEKHPIQWRLSMLSSHEMLNVNCRGMVAGQLFLPLDETDYIQFKLFSGLVLRHTYLLPFYVICSIDSLIVDRGGVNTNS